MRVLFFLFCFISAVHAKTDWYYYQVQEGETFESIGLSFHGDPELFKSRLHIKKLPPVGRYFKFPAKMLRLKCNAHFVPRHLKIDYRMQEVQVAYVDEHFKTKSELFKSLRKNPRCMKDLRPWRKLQYASYVMSKDDFEEKNGDVSTQTKVYSYAGIEYFTRREFGWISPWVGTFRGRLAKGDSAKGFSLGPQLDLEVGLGKVLEINQQTAYLKLWRNQFDFVGDQATFVGLHTNSSNFLGVAYEYIWATDNGLPWLGEIAGYYNLGSSYKPEVVGDKVNLSGYAIRASLKIPFIVDEYDNLFIQPSWQYMNFTGQQYSLYLNQISLSAGLKF